MSTLLSKVKEVITLLTVCMADPSCSSDWDRWILLAQEAIEEYECTEEEIHTLQRIITCLKEQQQAYMTVISMTDPTHDEMLVAEPKEPAEPKEEPLEEEKGLPSTEQLDALLQQKQTEQRTPEWYRQMSEVISASELHQLFSTPYQRGKLVLTKTQPPPLRNQPLAVFSSRMSAFDWGIRFEPVVKQIYIAKYGVELKELGRLHHPHDPRCTASPDGLVYDCPRNQRRGRLVEIKCPVTRKIDGTIPKEYYTQMQMQLQVTQLQKCDYIEAVFASPYQAMVQKRGPALYSGWIALVCHPSADVAEYPTYYYVYSPVHADETWRPDELPMGDEVVELIPWRLMQWSEQVVERKDEWWTALQPLLYAFWEDVALARRGEFDPPESSRPRKKPKAEPCMIQFTRLNQ